PATTSLKDLTLTSDGKSFPVGQLSWSQKFQSIPCGTTPEEALSRGCDFDLITTAWLPPSCIDYELMHEFSRNYAWRYFRDPEGTQTFPEEPIVLGHQVDPIWTTNAWHSTHCLYMWKKLNRALVRRTRVDGEAIKLAHTDHCTHTVVNMTSYEGQEGIHSISIAIH
ncbi:hypothetical protein DM02DRAFT_705397, partial [Periconia macrospinosa]